MSADSPPTLLVDREEAARLLSCCVRTIDALIRRGELRAVKIGRGVRLPVSELERWIAAQVGTEATPAQ